MSDDQAAEIERLKKDLRRRLAEAAERIPPMPRVVCPKCGRLLSPDYLEMTKWTEGQSRICALCFKEALDELAKGDDDNDTE